MNTDNRLMSGISLSSELAGLVETFDWTWRDINWLTINAMKSAFYPFDDRLALIDGQIKPGFVALDPDASTGSSPTGPKLSPRSPENRSSTDSGPRRHLEANRGSGLPAPRLAHGLEWDGRGDDLEIDLQLRLGATRPQHNAGLTCEPEHEGIGGRKLSDSSERSTSWSTARPASAVGG